MSQNKILLRAEAYVRAFFDEHDTKKYKFHNLEHTLTVVHAVETIAEKEKMPDDDKVIMMLAAWFHDLGYFVDLKNHEDVSRKIASDFLGENKAKETTISDVLNCIDATRMPQNPNNLLEKIVCDADLYHLSQNHFIESTFNLCKEWNALGVRKNKKSDFLPFTLQFLKDHQYHTNYGKNELEKLKQENIRIVELEIEKMKEKKNKKKKKDHAIPTESKKNTKELASGISSMFRITGRMQINLSSIADSKSSLLISVNAIMISLIVSYILGESNQNLMLIIPTLILLVTSLATVILAILAARPTISSGEFTREDIENRKANLLFFGSFYKMSLEEYDWGVREMMSDADYLYGNMIRDQYSLGLVLAKKYKLLRWAFHIFMGGLILACAAFILMLAMM